MESIANQLAPINFDEGYMLGQQPHEMGLRSSTYIEFSKWLNVRLDLQGAELIDPTIAGTAESPAVIPPGPEDKKGKFEPEPGYYQGFPEVKEGRRYYFYWDKTNWTMWDLGALPTEDKAPVIEEGNLMAPTSDATYKYVDPIYSALVEPIPYQRTRITLGADLKVASFVTGVMFTVKLDGKNNRLKVIRPSVQGNRFRIGYFVDDPIVSGSQFYDLFNDSSNTVLEKDVMAPIPAKYLGVYLSNESAQDINALDLDILGLGKYMSKETFIVKNIEPTSNNLFNKADILTNHDVVDGVIQARTGFNLSHPIPVSQGEAYTVVGKTLSITGRNLYFFKNADDLYVDSSILGGTGVSQTFIAPINGYVRTLVKDNSFTWLDTFQMNRGSVALPYQAWSEPFVTDVFNPTFMPAVEPKAFVKNIIVDMARGSIGNTGLMPLVQEIKSWKDNEFHNNFRTPRYLNLKGKFSINKNELTAYNVYLLQYDERFSFISRKLLTENDNKTDSKVEYIKFHISRIDGGVISNLPSVKINGKFSGDIYTMNNNETGNSVMSFMVRVTPNVNGRDMLDQGQANTPAQYDPNQYYTHGILRLPKNYDPKGEPVRLIYFAHSSAGTQLLDFYSPYKPYVQYLLDEGFAVFDMFSWSSKYPGVTQYMGTPDNSVCSQSVYNYVVENFNVRTDGVHLFGKSQGGVQVGNMQYTTSIPIKSKVYLAATPVPFGNNFGYTNPEKEASMRSFGIEGDVSPIFIVDGDTTVTPYYSAGSRDFLLQHAEKFIGYISCWCGVIMDSPDEQFPASYKPVQLLALNYTKIDHVPSKAFCAPDDSWIYQHLKAIQKWTRKGGGIFEFRDMPTGSGDPHHTTDTAGPFMNVQTKYGGILNNIPVAWVEMVQFFKRFD